MDYTVEKITRKIFVIKEIVSIFAVELEEEQMREGGGKFPFFLLMSSFFLLIMIGKDVIKSLVEGKLSGTDCYLVDVTVSPDNLITVEIDNDGGVSIDCCVELNRYIESSLDRGKEDFELEVGSSGITSPFKILRQYLKNIGNEVEMQLRNGVKLSGILKAADEDVATITVSKKVRKEGSKRATTALFDQTYKYSEINSTKYLIRF